MNKSVMAALVISAFASTAALAQQRDRGPDQVNAPWAASFWRYAGINVGRSDYKSDCFPGFGCDRGAGTLKIYAGGKLYNAFGLEVGYVNMGKAQAGGGDIEAHGLNLSLTAGVPLGANSSIFGKVGTTYGRTKISGTVPAVQTGTDNDWGLSYGIGGQIGLTRQWALRVDADRYRFSFINQGRQDVDTLTIGVQYQF